MTAALTEDSGNPAKEDGMNYHRNDDEMMRQAKGDEPITIDKLNDELESLLEEQAEMRKRNAYYIKNKTMIGYEGLSDDEAKKLKGRPDSYGYSELVYSSLDFAIISDKITNLRVHIKHLKWTQ